MSVPTNEVQKDDMLIPVSQSIYEPTTTQMAPLGTRLRMSGRIYVYALASASVPGGTVLCAAAPVASHQSGLLAMAAASVGAKVLSGTSSAAVAANLYAEGYFTVATGTNGGELYRVKGNAAGSTGFAVTLYDGLNIAITSGTTFALVPNPYQNVYIASQNLGVPVGVAPVNITSGGYAWIQAVGLGSPIHEAASAAGASLRVGTTGGLLAIFNATTNDATTVSALQIAKNSQLAATAGQNNPAFLSIPLL